MSFATQPSQAPYTPVWNAPATPSFAHWGARVGASLLDGLVAGLIPLILVIFALATGEPVNGPGGSTIVPTPVGAAAASIGSLLWIGLWVWNRVLRQGKTGQSFGKKALGIRLVSSTTGQPVGAGTAFLRELCHVVDAFFYLGYLWPLWDRERQTFSDKIVGTHVIAA